MAVLCAEDLQHIVKAAQHDDVQAFEILVTVYEKKIYAMARTLAGNDSDAQDIVQDVFVKLYLNIKSFQWGASFNTWFYRLAHNTAIDFIRRRKRREAISLDAPLQSGDNEILREVADVSTTPEEELEQKELSNIVAASLQMLPEEQRTILVMRDMQEASYEEIATQLGCPLGTVKSRIFRARAALKERILSQREQFSEHMRLIDSKGGGKH